MEIIVIIAGLVFGFSLSALITWPLIKRMLPGGAWDLELESDIRRLRNAQH